MLLPSASKLVFHVVSSKFISLLYSFSHIFSFKSRKKIGRKDKVKKFHCTKKSEHID